MLPIWKRERCVLTIHLIGVKSFEDSFPIYEVGNHQAEKFLPVLQVIKDRTFEHRTRCKSRQLYLPESLTKKLPQREGYDAGRSAVKAASRHQDLSVAERAQAGEQEELHALVHTTCLFPALAQVLFFFTLSHLCKMEEESELDRLLELEREVFSEGEEKKHGR